jgi:hypothetical protein
MQNKNDIGRAFEDLKDFMYKTYNGRLCERNNGGWKVGKNWYPTWEDCCYGIDKSLREFNELIKIQNPQS